MALFVTFKQTSAKEYFEKVNDRMSFYKQQLLSSLQEKKYQANNRRLPFFCDVFCKFCGLFMH